MSSKINHRKRSKKTDRAHREGFRYFCVNAKRKESKKLPMLPYGRGLI